MVYSFWTCAARCDLITMMVNKDTLQDGAWSSLDLMGDDSHHPRVGPTEVDDIWGAVAWQCVLNEGEQPPVLNAARGQRRFLSNGRQDADEGLIEHKSL